MDTIKNTAQRARKYVSYQAVSTLTGSAPAADGSILGSLFNVENSLPQFINIAFKAAIALGAILAVLRLGYAGIKYMTSDLPGAKNDAKGIISNAITGLLLLLAVWLILYQINPDILNLDIFRSLKSSPSGGARINGCLDSTGECASFNVSP